MKIRQMQLSKTTLIKLLLLFVFVVFSNQSFFYRIQDIGLQFGLLVFGFVWAISIAALFILAFQPFSIAKLLISVLVVLSATMGASYFMVVRQYMEFYQYESILNAANNTSDAISAFNNVLWLFLLGAVSLIALLLPSSIKTNKSLSLTVLTSFFVCCCIVIILFFRHGEGTKGLPTQYSALAYSAILSGEKLTSVRSETSPSVEILPLKTDFSGDVIFVMDESIRGDYLDLNVDTGVETGLLPFRDHYINFGSASSMTNCSDSGNLSMRYGISRSNYLDELKLKPSIWQYAKAAGYKTTYIDAQLIDGKLGNHMDEAEKALIDDFQQVPDNLMPLYEKDLSVAERIKQKINNGERDFIYVNKMGVHFPFEGKYPVSEKAYLPTMEKSNFLKSYPEEGEVEWPSQGDALTRLRFVNSYKNAVRWNMSTFFSRLLSELFLQPYVLFYTSDHGQSFHDDGREGYGTHCTIENADPEEGRVPFLLFTNDSVIKQKILSAKALNFNKVSQFNLPATLYHLMGYSLKDLNNYEKSIFSPLEKNDQKFISKYFVRFGQAPIWKSIH